MQEAAENCARSFGCAEVAPVEAIVVVPDVTALIVTSPVLILMTLIIEPTG